MPSWTSRIDLEFGDGEYAFELRAKEVEELQRVCGHDNKEGDRVPVGLAVIYQRLNLEMWGHNEIFETIRLGLIGGGMGSVEARRIAVRHAVPPYRVDQIGGPHVTARAIVNAAMHGLSVALKESPPTGEAETPKTETDAVSSTSGTSGQHS